ncbi:MAG: DUF3769 domain-containing protein [Cyanobacteria bacterium SW_9_44_58]|nr:MAG: DUF3769 domain-containing protein [Cyanobacteria bacterium SW_9_44_58]
MLFADVPPFPTPETVTDVSTLSPPALTQPLETLNDGQRIGRIRIKVRGGETQQWQIAQEDSQKPPRVLEITADRQSYDPQRQVITAKGNVTAQFAQGVLETYELKINIETRMAVGKGNVSFRRGEQVLNGDRFEYNFLKDQGVIQNGSGQVFQPTLERDISLELADETGAKTPPKTPLQENPLQDVSQQSQFQFAIGGGRDVENFSFPETGGEGIRRLRFQADQIQFNGGNWTATNIRITNDPFSPPELELRADTAKFRQLGPLRDEIVTSDQRLVFDDGFSLPIPQNRILLDRREQSPQLLEFGFDSDDRGGLFIQRDFTIFNTPKWELNVTPQYFLQQAVFEDSVADAAVFGVEGELTGNISPRTRFTADAEINGFEENVLEDNLRGSISLKQAVGRGQGQHRLNLEASFRDRFFNGSLGFETVQTSVGAVITSPTFTLGDSNIALSYQGGIQRINAETDVEKLLEPNSENDRVSLTRYQAAGSLSWGTLLWQGDTLPATAEQGLRYTPQPVRPNLSLNTGVTGVTTFYSNGDDQNSISLSLGVKGQLGHFSEKTFDYTSFNATYTEVIGEGESPFEFDRLADRKRISFGVIQQIYGPLLGGIQTSINLDDGEVISNDLILEYSRRTYNLRIRYNPTLEIGSVSIQINGFNWNGSPRTFDKVQPVQEGVIRD